MHRSFHLFALLAALALPIAGCESATGPEDGRLEVRLTSEVGASAAAALSPSLSISADHQTGMGPVALTDVESILVDIAEVLVLPATAADELENEDDTAWIALEGGPFDEVDLMNLTVTTLGTLPASSGVSEIVAVRLVFDDTRIRFNGHDAEALFIPSGKATIATSAVSTDGTTIELTFLQDASVKKVIRTGAGYLMPPVFEVDVENAE